MLNDLGNTQVSTEHTTHQNRRLDLFIRFNNGFRIGIENKIWAGDQDHQIKDYHVYLRSTTKDYVLIYLSCSGGKPPEYSIPATERKTLEAEGRLVCLSYRDFLAPWLRACLKECEADKVRWFIRDFIAWIEETCWEEEQNG